MGQYFTARRTDWQDATLATSILAILGSALRGPAAKWYMKRNEEINSVSQFFIELDSEFVLADLLQRLRDDINNLRLKDCKNRADYIAQLKHLNLQLKGMNEIDKIVYFQRGLRQSTKEQVQYRRCATLAEAITVVLDLKERIRTRAGMILRAFSLDRHILTSQNQWKSTAPSLSTQINVLNDQVV
ncbi:hypothetical protein PsorP6_012378 [Peronosclerospora sorghi]|uniref:Uncharacterized protein n=1 Tax=Peronosclerospora sorghi TaxID=230839 RepID=A0ACC0WGI4_9STRA|nr:hypothetical protein PsorP6_012378 [Peronosclerospora sorghi]